MYYRWKVKSCDLQSLLHFVSDFARQSRLRPTTSEGKACNRAILPVAGNRPDSYR
jgi:hypothetical protein